MRGARLGEPSPLSHGDIIMECFHQIKGDEIARIGGYAAKTWMKKPDDCNGVNCGAWRIARGLIRAIHLHNTRIFYRRLPFVIFASMKDKILA